MDVKRYWISPNGIACEDSEGEFVRYKDYKELDMDFQDYITATEMELKELRAKLGLSD